MGNLDAARKFREVQEAHEAMRRLEDFAQQFRYHIPTLRVEIDKVCNTTDLSRLQAIEHAKHRVMSGLPLGDTFPNDLRTDEKAT